MTEKVGRNDPCSCGSGKKYKNCCLQRSQRKNSPLGGRKFSVKVLSAGGINRPQPQNQQGEQLVRPVDYSVLMERSFGTALRSHEDKPPIPSNPAEYLIQEEPVDPAE